jgi:anti-sigma28 factor (negative regulator of flagellin synthesis)
MKIDQQNIAGANSSQSIALNSTSGQRTPTAAPTAGDQAELSGISKAIQSFQSDRSSRVAQLTALVRSGQYDVSPSLIAGGIVNEALGATSQSASLSR